ncbi:MAG: glycogen/starch/alpha-glucan phosphorylase [Candidatus Competibacteraceae bacterium]|nr:glycogen/starch/alpha-glucan phosphorylase [Candidatus Competibacteraceae bacterium]
MQNTVQNTTTDALLTSPELAMDADGIATDLRRYFCNTLGRDRISTSPHYLYTALAFTLRDRLMERLNKTRHAYEQRNSRRTCYLSMEYLMGRSLTNAMLNLGGTDSVHQALAELGLRLEEVAQYEHDAGLGNGGLGRLAACLLDSCATLGLPVIGYGIRYRYGMFRQHIENGHQKEEPDHWLRDGHPWELERPEYTQRIQFGGRSEYYQGFDGQLRVRWVDTHDVLAVPYDIPIPGYQNDTVNTLRLWSAIATDEFDLSEFNAGSYPEAVAAKNAAENITMVLYPNDASENGKELRLRQQYFLAAASLRDSLRQWHNRYGKDPQSLVEHFAETHCFQLNDTHPSIAVAELMRLLMDEHHLGWDAAWGIVTRCMAYTNHTLLPEALERWPVRLFQELLPRHLEIIYEINARFLAEVARRWPGDNQRQQRMSLIEEGPEPMVRMAYLAIVGSFSVNGVAELHSNLLKQGLFRDFYELWPQRFRNVTNGVTPRRWLAACNPALAELITQSIGPHWVTDLSQLQQLVPYAEDAAFRTRWQSVKHANKIRLAQLVQAECGVTFDPAALFDVQVKRIHEYKRQLLNILHVIHLYCRIKRGDLDGWVKRCVLIGGKAAPGYTMAKLIIKFINNVAQVINKDPAVGDLLKVAFLPNYCVTSMEIVCPGTDLSEQISTAGKEASGTGNMKFMMNGALTIGTLDGANIEIREAVGADHFFLFGLNAEQVEAARDGYDPQTLIANDPDLKEVIALIRSGYFNQFEPGLFQPILAAIESPGDPWLTAADFASFVAAQQRVAEAYQDTAHWTRMSILNSAASGRFSTDRTIQDYNSAIWQLEPVVVR